MAANKVKGAPPSKWKGANDGPSRTKYHSEGVIAHALRKIRNLMRHNGLSARAAFTLWEKTRKRRRETLLLSYVEREVIRMTNKATA